MPQATIDVLNPDLGALFKLGSNAALEAVTSITQKERARIAKLLSQMLSDLREKISRSLTPKGPLERLKQMVALAMQGVAEAKQTADSLKSIGQVNVSLSEALKPGIAAVGLNRFSSLLIQAKQTFALLWNSITAIDLDFWYALAKEVIREVLLQLINVVEDYLLALIGGAASAVTDFARRIGSIEEVYGAYS